MKRLMVAAFATLFAAGTLAQTFVPPARPGNSDVLRLGERFTTLFVSCGTPITPDCPNQLEPLPGAVLVHYVTLGGRATTNCSGWLFVERIQESGLQRTELMRLVLIAGAFDNMVLTLPKPIRLEAGDVIGVAVAQGTCAMLADLGIERLADVGIGLFAPFRG